MTEPATVLAPTVDPLSPDGFDAALRETLQKEIEVFPARTWWPSNLGHPCDRALVWNFTRWEEKKPHDVVLQSIFDEGNLHQDAISPRGRHSSSIYSRLEQMGFQIDREFRAAEWRSKNGGVISGKPDGRFIGFRGVRFAEPVVFDGKTMVEHQWQRISSVEDLYHAASPYVRGYPTQVLIYSFLENRERGALVLKSKQTGLLKFIPVPLDYAAVELMLKRVERLQPMVAAKEDPPPIAYDEATCGRCAFNHLCYPPKDYGAGLVPLEDDDLLDDVARREELQAAYREYGRLDKRVKSSLKRLGTFEAALLGPFLIERTERPVRAYPVEARTDVIFDIKRVDTPKAIETDDD